MEKIPVIVLTGGPCGGKTTVISFLRQKFADLGFTVITVPETATELINSGVVPGDTLDRADFQEQLLRLTLEKEKRFIAAAQVIKASKKLILCDRGLMDAPAYVTAQEFEKLLVTIGTDVVSLRDKHYDAVVFLRSVAFDAPEIYTCANNNARKEGIYKAKALDEETLAAWTGHPHLIIIDNSTGIEGKAHRAFQAICRVLGIPAPLEIERKFLVTCFEIDNLPKPCTKIHIVQHYLTCKTEGEEERIRIREQSGGRTYYHTIKKPVGTGVRIEKERQIDEEEYLLLLKRADPQYAKIEKWRFCFVWENQYFELDCYLKPPGLYILEIELTEQNEKVAIPDCFIGKAKEVTDDPQYSNRNIARKLATQT